MTNIYVILNPITGEPVYIGQTVKTLGARLSNHITASIKNSSFIQKWIYSIISNGGRPGIFLLDQVTNEPDFWEDFYIQLFKGWGFNLLNSVSGGKKNIKNILPFLQKENYFPVNCVEIIMLDENNNFIQEFKSISSCCKELKLDREKIRECLVGKRNSGNGIWKEVKSYKGYVFIFKDKYDPTKDYTVKRREVNKGRLNRIIAQYTLEGEFIRTYISVMEVERITGIKNSTISRVCCNKYKTNINNNFIWKYITLDK